MTFAPFRSLAIVAGAIAVAATACSTSDIDSAGSQAEVASLADEADDGAREPVDAGSGGLDNEAATATPGSADSEAAERDQPERELEADEAFARFEDCMAEHGAEVFTGSSGAELPEIDDEAAPADGATLDDIEAAEAECSPILDEAFGSFEMSPEEEAEAADAMLAIEKCLSDRGYDVDVSGGMLEISPDVDFDELQLEFEDCAVAGGGPVASIGGG